MKRNLYGLLALLFLCSGATVPAQAQDDTDFGVWSKMKVSHSLDKRFSLEGGLEFRTKEQFQEVDRWAGFVGASYKALPFLKLQAGYEYHYRYRNAKGWKSRQRYHLGATGELKLPSWKLSLRERFQHTWEPSKDDFHLRSQVKAAYVPQNSRLSPYASLEIYNHLNDGFDLSRTRYRLGSTWKLSRAWQVDLYYMYQYETARKKHVFGIEGSYSF
ncbi:hypothetical protein, secreted [gut metagenome]|uniref:DUF2490 domain-containing protein n=1 Tax=gut metagenome TaxID=749906 RepID=J9FFR5_9ZZZZ